MRVSRWSILTSSLSLGTFSTDPYSGRYAVVLPRGYNYALTAQAPGYLFNSEQVLVPADLERDVSRTIDFTLQPINGSIRLLVFFKDNDRNFERESMNDLDRLAIFLLANPTLSVEIAGHTDNAGDAAANIVLSTERAQAVKSYLVGNRVDADRIRIKGYGSSQPIASNDTEEGRALNRRVEMRVIEPNSAPEGERGKDVCRPFLTMPIQRAAESRSSQQPTPRLSTP